MTVYVLEGVVPQQDDGSPETFEILGVYTTAAIMEEATDKFRELDYVTFRAVVRDLDAAY
jgi:hypothetical protein